MEHLALVSESGVANHAPVALFAYNRLQHLQKTIDALKANSEAPTSLLYIFSDGAKNTADEKAVNEVRQYIQKVDGFAKVCVIELDKNYGLAKSIINGVSKVCQEHGRAIVLEDDILVSRYFLKYMNDGLALYEHDERVISIHGHQYPITENLPETFFLRGADCWGWATWQRGWDLFEPDGARLLQELMARKLTHSFDFDGAYPHTKMLKDQINGKNNSWAIRWHASAFLRDKLTLYPGRSLVHNIGLDGSGTHCSETKDFSGELARSPIAVEDVEVEESLIARQQFVKFHIRTQPSLPVRAAKKIFSQIRWMKKNGYGK